MNSLAKAHLVACKLALGPVLLAQAKRLRQTALRLPEAEGERQGSVPKSGRPLRILFVGDSSAAGVGVSHQSEALAAPTVRHLSELTQLSLQWAASSQNMAQDRFHPGPRQYQAWATRLAGLIHEGLPRELLPVFLSPAAGPG